MADHTDLPEIRNVLAAFAEATDVGTVEEYLALLTDDAVIELPGIEPRRGTDELRAGAEGSRKAGILGPGSSTFHHLGATHVVVDGDTATCTTGFVFWTGIDGTPQPSRAGRYTDRLERTGDGWRLAHRVVAFG